MSNVSIDLIRQVLDHQIVDVDETPCGIVDDLELSGAAGEPLQVAALLVGPGAWGPRLPALVAWVVRWPMGSELTRVAWHEVARIGEHIQLKGTAPALGLGKSDRKAARWLKWIPGNEKKKTH